MTSDSVHYPRISISFCEKCKWNLRASWYLQELLSTFGSQLGEVALTASSISGTFIIKGQKDINSDIIILWERKTDGGFPDSKILKQRVRNSFFPEKNLGHSDHNGKSTERKNIDETGLVTVDPRQKKVENDIKWKEDKQCTEC